MLFYAEELNFKGPLKVKTPAALITPVFQTNKIIQAWFNRETFLSIEKKYS